MTGPGAELRAPGPPGSELGSTYRLQLRPGDLDWARGVLDYVADLGCQTLYLSPLAQAAPGSTHGYDVTDPTRIDPALGGWAAWRRLLAQAGGRGMKVLLDIVPNHLAASEENPWWADVLRQGSRSPHARVFDVDWSALGGQVLLPILARPFAEELTTGALAVVVAGASGEPAGVHPGEPVLAYGPRRLPLDPRSWPELASSPAELARRTAGRPGHPGSYEALEALLARQNFRLAWWRVGPTQLNYRRFLDIDSLVGVRVEDPAVFRATHRLVGRLAADPRVAGVRVDHVDGLADPAGYLLSLRDLLDGARADGAPQAAIVVEKVLGAREELPPWPVAGTTGYEFAAAALGLFVDPSGLARLPGAPNGEGAFASLARQGRRLALETVFPGLLDDLARTFTTLARASRRGHEAGPPGVRRALVELASALDAYRCYPRDGVSGARAVRLARHAAARARAARPSEDRSRPAPHPADPDQGDPDVLVDELADVIFGVQPAAGGSPPDLERRVAARRWQQLCAAVSAKGVEDTALYRLDGSLVAADVGGNPDHPALDPAGFHRLMAERQRRFPGGLNATSTHDSKRSEDVRCRLAALSEAAGPYAAAVRRWHRRYAPLVARRGIDPAEERFLYQTLAGIWPPTPLAAEPRRGRARQALVDRLQGYAIKAAREAKLRTSWTDPDLAHEAALGSFLATLLTAPAGDPFVSDMDRLIASIGPAAASASLALVALKATAPGVPDLYQGCETWSFTLVDPDNRSPMDLGAARAALDRLGGDPDPAALLARWPDGQVKLHLTRVLLRHRRAQPELVARGAYLPLTVRGPAADHVVAFARRFRGRWSCTVVPRLTYALAGPGRFPLGTSVWGDTQVVLPPGAPRHFQELASGATLGASGGTLLVGRLLGTLPAAVAFGVARPAAGPGPQRDP